MDGGNPGGGAGVATARPSQAGGQEGPPPRGALRGAPSPRPPRRRGTTRNIHFYNEDLNDESETVIEYCFL